MEEEKISGIEVLLLPLAVIMEKALDILLEIRELFMGK